MYPVSPSAYDRAITVFSPDGRLFQVEYAREAVKRGATAIGMITKEGVILIAHKTSASKLIVAESLKKIFEIDDHIAVVASGIDGDARRLVDDVIFEAQKYRYTYSEPADVEYLSKHTADTMQLYTQYGGARPFGVSLMFGGIDLDSHLFEVDPSGTFTGSNAIVIGAGKTEVIEFLEKEYKEGLSLEEGIALDFKAMKEVPDMKIKTAIFDIGIIEKKTKKFKFLSKEEVAEYKKRI